MDYGFDLGQMFQRLVKYVVMGFAIAVAAFYIPKSGKMRLEEVVMISITAAATFAVLDFFAPSIGSAARTGAGFGVGANLVGFPA